MKKITVKMRRKIVEELHERGFSTRDIQYILEALPVSHATIANDIKHIETLQGVDKK